MQLYLSPEIDGFPAGSVDVRFPYNPSLVEKLKAVVPPSDRMWDKTRKTWAVSLAYAPVLLREFGDNLSIHPDAITPIANACYRAEQAMLTLFATTSTPPPIAQQWLSQHRITL